jgi:tRNA(fMet)-specific endonuclease VapC
MSESLVDTDVFSFIFKGDDRAEAYRQHLDGRSVYLSFMTVAELYRWALERNWGNAKVAALREHIDACGILEPNDAVRWQWAKLMSVKGAPMSAADAWIAATALAFDLPLVTHNRADFDRIADLKVVSEASGR